MHAIDKLLDVAVAHRVEALLQVDVHTPCTPTAGSPEGTRRQNVAR